MSLAQDSAIGRRGGFAGFFSGWSIGEWLIVLVCGYFVALKLVYSFFAFPIADEAYYWMWGQHPGLSYFDHPPLQGWVEGVFHAILGRSLFALRLPALIAFGVNVWIFWLVAGRIAGADRRLVFLRSLLVYLASPLFGFFGSVVFIDYLLTTLMLASGYLFFCYFADVETGGRPRVWQLLAAAVLLGFAGLAKYNGAYLGLAVLGTVLTRRQLRPLLRSWPIYAAGAIAVAMQAPVLIWNLQHGFASFNFRMSDSNGGAGTFTGFHIEAMKAFALDQTGMLSIFMVPVIVRFFWARPDAGFERTGKVIAIWTFWLSSLTFLYISNYSWVLWWWNSAAFVLVFPFAGKFIGRYLLTLHTFWGLALITVMALSYSVSPGIPGVWRAPVGETENVYGWDEVTAAVRAAVADNNPDFLATNRYQSASQLAFALDDPNVTAISVRHDQYDFWFDAAAHAGQSAVILVDDQGDMESYKSAFASVRKIGQVNVSRFGFALKTYELYFGEGYAAPR